MFEKKESILRFVLPCTGNPVKVMDRFTSRGKRALNRTEWRGKEPRSCAVTGLHSRTHPPTTKEPLLFDVEVTYRPKGCIAYVGNTKYDGWTAMMLDRGRDGILLDGHGSPLPEGQPEVYLPVEVYDDIDFNEIDFGNFIGESPAEGVEHLTIDAVKRAIREGIERNGGGGGIFSSFMAPRRHRPLVKIALSQGPSGTDVDGFGTRIVRINALTPHLQQVIVDELNDLIGGFVEGRYSIKNMATEGLTFVELADSFVDCTPNSEGKPSRFNCLKEFVPAGFFDELALRLMSTYDMAVSVVDGENGGLLLRRPEGPKNAFGMNGKSTS